MLKLRISILFLFLFILACQTGNNENERVKKKNNYCSFCVSSSDFKPLKKRYIRSKQKEIAEYYHRYFDSLGFNGGFLVAKNGQVLFERYDGYSNYEKSEKMHKNSALHLASVGKVLTATAIFRLIETKKIKLDQKVNTVLPELPYDEVTIRMLLNHRSGITKYANFTAPDSIWGVEKTLHNQDVLDLLSKFKVPLDFPPNTKFVYNNTNYALLALIIEKVTKKSFKLAMKDLVFDPLGMKNTFVFILEEDKDRVSQSYSSRMKIQEFDNLDAIYGDKNIYSTPRDLLKFDLAMQKNEFISKKLKREIFKGYSYERAGVKNYGLGIRLKEWETGQKVFYHNGWWHGNTSAYITLKKEGVTIIALSNKFTRKVYDIIRLSSLFGDYPFNVDDEEVDATGILVPTKTQDDTLKFTR
jgi:CubicO group peptidase (beta-lactamase class C family)